MDAGSNYVVCAWASLPSHVLTKDRTQTTPTVGKLTETHPRQLIPHLHIDGLRRVACMRGPGREFLSIDSTKGAIECPRPQAKADSSSDETPVDLGSRGGLVSRISSGRRGNGSASSSPPRGALVAELPTVAEVLRTAKVFLQPTHAVERQFYADCYRACQVMPTSNSSSSSTIGSPTGRTPAVTAAAAAAGGGGSGRPAPHSPPQLPYLSSVPEVALRLGCLGHRVVVRRVTDSRHYWSRSMTNIFCYSVVPGTGIGYVLDPSFKEHFRAGRMSERYRDIWECLPPLFIGPPAKLVQLVQILCTELQMSFESDHRQLPPWRTFSCTINRWMSPVFRDLTAPLRRLMPAAAAGAGGGRASGMIPAAEAQAFLRMCEDLLANTPSSRRGSSRGVAAAAIEVTGALTKGVASAGQGQSTVAATSEQRTAASAASGSSTQVGVMEEHRGDESELGRDADTTGGGRAAAWRIATAVSCSAGGGGATRLVSYEAVGRGVAAQVKVPGGVVGAATAATAAASSTAWAPPLVPPRPLQPVPFRTIAGFDYRPRQHSMCSGVQVEAMARAAAALRVALVAATATTAEDSSGASTVVVEGSCSPVLGTVVGRSEELVTAAWSSLGGAHELQPPLSPDSGNDEGRETCSIRLLGGVAAGGTSVAAAGSRAGLLTRSLRFSS